MKALDRIANIAIIMAVAVFLTVVVRGGYLHRAPAAVDPLGPQVGKTVDLPGIQFPAKHDSLLLGISTSCHYCEASLPFYRRLAGQAQGKLAVIAVLPQPQAEGEKYLSGAGITGVQVVSAKLTTIDVSGTPTILLVDGSGKIKSFWVGMLDDAGQQKVMAAALLQGGTSAPHS